MREIQGYHILEEVEGKTLLEKVKNCFAYGNDEDDGIVEGMVLSYEGTSTLSLYNYSEMHGDIETKLIVEDIANNLNRVNESMLEDFYKQYFFYYQK